MHPSIKFNKGNIIIVDGAHHGQTSLLFAKKLKGHCKIYVFEPDSVNFDSLICLTKFGKNNYIKPVMAGLWENNMFGLLNTDLESRSTSKSYFVDNNNNNGAKINLLSIDSSCESHQIVPSHIKMDIEGSEMKALQGAKNIIKQHKPSLIISLYHKAEDLWEIPFFLTSVGCKYKYYVGQYSSKVTDTVLYCTT